MTNKKSHRDALDRLTAALVENILSTSDEEIIGEAQDDHEVPADAAAGVRALSEKAAMLAAKNRLAAARLAVANDRRRPAGGSPLDPAEARRRLERILSQDPNLTLAARKGQGLSDKDVLGMLEDLEELGIAPDPGEP
ncbi:MAG: hypothetical protein M0002_20520 [Rhodospirillales bacterium]|nr:hypothetical protein [Rhodospirillales bacterium]